MKKHLLISVLTLSVLICFPLTAPAKTYTVIVADYYFSPDTLNIAAGDTVLWVFKGNSHTTTSGSNCMKDNIWDSGFVVPGGTYQFTFNKAGTYPYFCTPHCDIGMTGQITVTQPAPGISPGIQANGSTAPITIKSGDTLVISVQLSSGTYLGTNADWWFVEQTPSGAIFSFDISKTPPAFDVSGLSVVMTTNLYDFGYSQVYQASGLPVGNYFFYFGIDTTPNGSLDYDALTYSYVQVTVTQ